MFEQHPVPQNISSYQFHLVGDMTLKQFLELAGGVVVGVIFYATGLPAIIKWPLILISAAFGAALAFVPLEERPLEKWIFAFFRSVYSPTLFHWEKKDNVKYFGDETQPTLEASAGEAKTNAFANIPFLNKLEAGEDSYLSKLTQIFNPTSSQPAQPVVPQQAAKQDTTSQTVQINVPTSVLQPVAKPVEPVQQQTVQVQPQIVSDTQKPIMVSASTKPDNGEVLTMHSTSSTTGVSPLTASAPAAGQREVVVPQNTIIGFDAPSRPQITVEEIPEVKEKVDLTQTAVNPTLVGATINNAQGANFSSNAAPPSVPEIKNTVSGQVIASDGKIIDGAILEIRDSEGRAVRALKTNKAGHFLIVTPLATGKYRIVIEKEGFNFDPVEFEAENNIIQPIAIHARASV